MRAYTPQKLLAASNLLDLHNHPIVFADRRQEMANDRPSQGYSYIAGDRRMDEEQQHGNNQGTQGGLAPASLATTFTQLTTAMPLIEGEIPRCVQLSRTTVQPFCTQISAQLRPPGCIARECQHECCWNSYVQYQQILTGQVLPDNARRSSSHSSRRASK